MVNTWLLTGTQDGRKPCEPDTKVVQRPMKAIKARKLCLLPLVPGVLGWLLIGRKFCICLSNPLQKYYDSIR